MAETPNSSLLPGDSPPWASHWIIPVLLVLFGVCLWLTAAQTSPTRLQFELSIVAVLICFIPPLNRFLTRLFGGTAIGLTYRIAAEKIDGAFGWVVSLLVIATPGLRRAARYLLDRADNSLRFLGTAEPLASRHPE